ncbi:hypothetical protein AAFF_G00332990 [Aldrovandia affinis]|uniref:Uncharacterized protein n=1 Tax=Aldrovandia affinis TaxID=143900 RepID=A0AAD7SLJ8_9TELE|nr:hypothetical protein AAFF_G00332990 [Aldrovandia affinis]
MSADRECLCTAEGLQITGNLKRDVVPHRTGEAWQRYYLSPPVFHQTLQKTTAFRRQGPSQTATEPGLLVSPQTTGEGSVFHQGGQNSAGLTAAWLGLLPISSNQ